jgi:predicted protein tyrosine phosphatase
MQEQTKTQDIQGLTAPYDNPWQGKELRLLFVCSVGMLRSPTFADVATSKGYNARSCGSDIGFALIPISANLVYWADKIVFMNYENFVQARINLEEYSSLIGKKAVILSIDDSFERNHHLLISTAHNEIDYIARNINNERI